MESNVFSNPDVAILNGGKYFEDLLSLIMVTELIPEEKTVNDNINKLKEFGILSYEMKDRFHQARIARNKGIHDNANNKYAYQLCALLFQISVWFYKKYSGDKNFRSPSFDRSLIVEKDKKMNQDSKPSNFDENGMRTLLEDVLDEKMKNIMQNIGNNTSTTNEQIPNKNVSKNEFKGNAEVKKASDLEYEFSKTKGSYLLTELSKLKKSSKESIEDSNGFDNEFKKYMHVDREIQYELENKLDELSNNNSSQLIMLSGSVGDGKSHLLSYMKYKHPELMNKFRVHNDATESFDPKLTAIETLKKVLEPFSDVNIEKSNEKLILAINLGILSNLMDDEYIKNNYSKLYEILETVDIFDNSAKTTNITKNFLTIINFTDYQLYEIDEGKASSDFILSLLNKVTNQSDKNPFYLAYK